MQSFVCAICQGSYPEALHHEHHKIPKSLGGPDTPDNLVGLCQTDHQLLHSISYMLTNPKRKHEVEPTLASVYPNKIAIQRRVIEFASLVAREMLLKKEIKKEEDAETRITVEIPNLYVQLLRLAGYDNPHKNGRPLGNGSLVRQVIADYLSRKFPMRRDEILALRKKKSGSD